MIPLRWHLPRETCELDETPAEPLALTFDARRRSRQRIDLPDGRVLAIALPPGTAMQPGDRLVGEGDVRFIVVAADEEVVRIAAPDALALARAAYHLGNRHVPVEVAEGYLAIEPDAVLEDMLHRLGVATERRFAPFQPEAGAYGGGHRHGHDETFAEDHALAQSLFVRHGGDMLR